MTPLSPRLGASFRAWDGSPPHGHRIL